MALKARRGRLLFAFLGLAGSVPLTSCDDSSPSGNGPQLSVSYSPLDAGSDAKPSNSVSRKLFEMSGQVRLAVFKDYLNQSGETCDYVTGAVLLGNDGHTDFWRVGCSDSDDWMVSIAPDSSTRILSCQVAQSAGGDCKPFAVKGKPERPHRR